MVAIQVSEETLQEWTDLLRELHASAEPATTGRIADMLSQLNPGSVRGGEAAPPEPGASPSIAQGAWEQLRAWQNDGTWQVLVEGLSLLSASKSSVTAPMAERVATLMAEVAPLLVLASDPAAKTVMQDALDHASALSAMLSQLGAWYQDGTWQVLVEMTTLVRAMRDSVSAAIIERLADTGQDAGRALVKVLNTGLLDAVPLLAAAVTDAFGQTRTNPQRVTIRSMLRMLKDPDVQISLQTLFGLLTRLPKILEEL